MPFAICQVDVPPPPLACGFKAGDQAQISLFRHGFGQECALQVQYFSETKQRWVETLVLRMFELEGNICYDLDCKKGVSADKAAEVPSACWSAYPWRPPAFTGPLLATGLPRALRGAMQENERRAPDDGPWRLLEVGEQVEYWSVSAGRWLPAKAEKSDRMSSPSVLPLQTLPVGSCA